MNFTLGIQPIDYASCNKRADLRPSANHLHTQPHTSVAWSAESSNYGIAIEADAKICHSGNCYRQVAVNRYLAKESSSEARCRHRSIGKCTDVSLNPSYSGANVRIAECRDHRVVATGGTQNLCLRLAHACLRALHLRLQFRHIEHSQHLAL